MQNSAIRERHLCTTLRCHWFRPSSILLTHTLPWLPEHALASLVCSVHASHPPRYFRLTGCVNCMSPIQFSYKFLYWPEPGGFWGFWPSCKLHLYFTKVQMFSQCPVPWRPTSIFLSHCLPPQIPTLTPWPPTPRCTISVDNGSFTEISYSILFTDEQICQVLQLIS